MGTKDAYYEWRIRNLEETIMDLRLENDKLRDKLAFNKNLVQKKNDLIAGMIHGR